MARPVYRTISELDRFEDETCRRLVAEAMRRRPVRGWISLLSACGVFGIVFAAWMFVLGRILFLILATVCTSDAAVVVAVAIFLTIGGWLACRTAWWWRRVWVRAAVRSLFGGGACPGCGYSLAGLAAPEGVMRCPECGLAAGPAPAGPAGGSA